MLFGSNVETATKWAKDFFKNVSSIGVGAFWNCRIEVQAIPFYFPGKLQKLDGSCFGYMSTGISSAQFGEPNDPTQLDKNLICVKTF